MQRQRLLERTFHTCFTLSEADSFDNDKVMPVNLGILHCRGRRYGSIHVSKIYCKWPQWSVSRSYTHTSAQCSFASVGLAQARPNDHQCFMCCTGGTDYFSHTPGSRSLHSYPPQHHKVNVPCNLRICAILRLRCPFSESRDCADNLEMTYIDYRVCIFIIYIHVHVTEIFCASVKRLARQIFMVLSV